MNLNLEAKEILRTADITPRQWAQRWYGSDMWGGDACGCPDDRCRGHHHERGESCGCLTALIRDWREVS